jgi:hypothetical protein
MHHDAYHHNVVDSFQIPRPARFLQHLPSCLQNPESVFDVLTGARLHFSIMLPFLSLWGMNGLQKTTPLRVNPVCYKVIAAILMAIDLEGHAITRTLQQIREHRRAVKDIYVVISTR